MQVDRLNEVLVFGVKLLVRVAEQVVETTAGGLYGVNAVVGGVSPRQLTQPNGGRGANAIWFALDGGPKVHLPLSQELGAGLLFDHSTGSDESKLAFGADRAAHRAPIFVAIPGASAKGAGGVPPAE